MVLWSTCSLPCRPSPLFMFVADLLDERKRHLPRKASLRLHHPQMPVYLPVTYSMRKWLPCC